MFLHNRLWGPLRCFPSGCSPNAYVTAGGFHQPHGEKKKERKRLKTWWRNSAGCGTDRVAHVLDVSGSSMWFCNCFVFRAARCSLLRYRLFGWISSNVYVPFAWCNYVFLLWFNSHQSVSGTTSTPALPQQSSPLGPRQLVISVYQLHSDVQALAASSPWSVEVLLFETLRLSVCFVKWPAAVGLWTVSLKPCRPLAILSIFTFVLKWNPLLSWVRSLGSSAKLDHSVFVSWHYLKIYWSVV